MQKGRITKGVAGLYLVKTDNAEYKCALRGIFRKQKLTPIVGDFVSITVLDEESKAAVIEKIHERKNEMLRPKVANVDRSLLVFSSSSPPMNFDLLDKMIILCEEQSIEINICINKMDIYPEIKSEIEEIYGPCKYNIIFTEGTFSDEIFQKIFKNNLVFLAGPSGVGKSTLINSLNKNLQLQVGTISKKLNRGKHTTRQVELIELGENSFIFDTPGFSLIELKHIKKENLQLYFREFLPYINSCQFAGCSHVKENDCAVKDQVSKTIHEKRYARYVGLYEGL